MSKIRRWGAHHHTAGAEGGSRQLFAVATAPLSLTPPALGSCLLPAPRASKMLRNGDDFQQPGREPGHNTGNNGPMTGSAGAAASAYEAPAARPMRQVPPGLAVSSQTSPPAVAASPERAAGGVFLAGRKSKHPERDALVERLWKQTNPKLTGDEIAAQVGMTPYALKSLIQRMRLANRVPGQPSALETLSPEQLEDFKRRYAAHERRKDIAARFGLCVGVLPRLARRLGLKVVALSNGSQRWKGEADDATLIRLVAEGRTLLEVARLMPYSYVTIQKHAARLGVAVDPAVLIASRQAGARRLNALRQAGLVAKSGPKNATPPKRQVAARSQTRRTAVSKPVPAAAATPEQAPAPIQFKPWTPGIDDEGCNYVLQVRPIAYCGAPRRDRRCSYCAEHAAKLLRAYDPVPRRAEAA